jgi:nitrite reductase/ring-hydroxylating ferredoxin subunit
MEKGTAHFLCAAADVDPGTVRRVEIDGDGYAVYNIDGKFYVTDDRCTHGLASLAEGELQGDVIEWRLSCADRQAGPAPLQHSFAHFCGRAS